MAWTGGKSLGECTDESYDEGFREALRQVEEVAYAARDASPFDGRTREGRLWTEGARHVHQAVYNFLQGAK